MTINYLEQVGNLQSVQIQPLLFLQSEKIFNFKINIKWKKLIIINNKINTVLMLTPPSLKKKKLILIG